jgi:hypothetical protein
MGSFATLLSRALHNYSIALRYGDPATRTPLSFYEFVHRDDLDSFLKLGCVKWEKVNKASML